MTIKRQRRPKPVKHRWLDQWLVAKGEALQRLVAQTTAFIQHHEDATGARQRGRRPDDKVRHQRLVEVVTANLAYGVLNPPETGRIAIDTRQGEAGRSRYDNPAVAPKTLRKLTDHLLALDIVDFKRSRAIRGEKDSISPSDWFGTKVQECAVSLADFERDLDQELIILTRTNRGRFDPFVDTQAPAKRERVSYRETAQTTAMRQQMRDLNGWLAAADVTFVDDGGPLVDPYDRLMRRYFIVRDDQEERFDQSGRLFGGFWQTLRSDRRRGIRINGETVAVLDYSSMFTRLAYAELGISSPLGDLYGIAGAEGYRSGIKLAMNCFFFDSSSSRKSWPSGLGVGVGDDEAAKNGEVPAAEYQARLPAGWTVKKAKLAILARHPVLAEAFGRGIGYRLMHRESEVLLAVLEELRRRNIIGLGLHDGLLVPSARATEAQRVMEDVAEVTTGYKLSVTLKLLDDEGR
jgi:hypothetical protein